MNRPVVFVAWILVIVSCAFQGQAAGTDDGSCTEAWDTCRTTYNGRNVLANLAREDDPNVVVPDTHPLKIDVSYLDPNTCVTQTDTGTTFFGYRLVRRDGTTDVIGLYNARGNFCGIQTRFPQYEILSRKTPFRYDQLPIFQTEIVNNVEYFVLTAYTCDPATICNEILKPNLAPENQAAGDRLIFQNGSDPTLASNLNNVPSIKQNTTTTFHIALKYNGKCVKLCSYYNVRIIGALPFIPNKMFEAKKNETQIITTLLGCSINDVL